LAVDLRAIARLKPWYACICRRCWIHKSTERERKGLNTRVEKFDLEHAIRDRARLSDQLIETLFSCRADAFFVNVAAVSCAGRLPIEEHAEPHGRTSRGRSHDQVQIAGVKTVRDPATASVQQGCLGLDGPFA
jgi:hypothetical protein